VGARRTTCGPILAGSLLTGAPPDGRPQFLTRAALELKLLIIYIERLRSFIVGYLELLTPVNVEVLSRLFRQSKQAPQTLPRGLRRRGHRIRFLVTPVGAGEVRPPPSGGDSCFQMGGAHGLAAATLDLLGLGGPDLWSACAGAAGSGTSCTPCVLQGGRKMEVRGEERVRRADAGIPGEAGTSANMRAPGVCSLPCIAMQGAPPMRAG
jgi:hypothetical protein